MFIEVIHIEYYRRSCMRVHMYAWVTRLRIVKEKYSAVFNSAVADKNRRIAEIKNPQKLPAIRYILKMDPDFNKTKHVCKSYALTMGLFHRGNKVNKL